MTRSSTPSVSKSDQRALAGWLQCTNLVSGETFYMDQGTGETSEHPPRETKAAKREKGSFETGLYQIEEDAGDALDFHASAGKGLEQILASLTLVRDDAAKILDTERRMLSSKLSSESLKKLDDIVSSFESIIDKEEQMHDRQSGHIGKILESAHASHKLNSIESTLFRSSVIKMYGKMHSEIVMEQYPRFFSDMSLLAHVQKRSVHCTIYLPESHFQKHNKTTVALAIQESTNALLATLFRLTQSRGLLQEDKSDLSLDRCLLKARGRDEYFHGEEPIVSYRFIREMLNRMEPIEFAMVVLADDQSISDQANENAVAASADLEEAYKSKVATDVRIEDMLQVKAQNALPYHEIADRDVHVQLGVLKVDALSLKALKQSADVHKLSHMHVKVFLIHGSTILFDGPWSSSHVALCEEMVFKETVSVQTKSDSPVKWKQLPRETRFCYVLCLTSKDGKELPFCWNFHYMINDLSELRHGEETLHLFYIDPKVHTNNTKSGKWDFLKRMNTGVACKKHGYTALDHLWQESVLHVTFPDFGGIVTRDSCEEEYKHLKSIDATSVNRQVELDKLPKDMQDIVQRVVSSTMLYPLTPTERSCMWVVRHHLVGLSTALAPFLQSVDWANMSHRSEAYRFLGNWEAPIQTITCLEMLGADFADTIVRNAAVQVLENIGDAELCELLPQLIQCLKYEPYEKSKLGLFLLRRAWKSPVLVGNHLFWALVFEMTRPMFATRYALLLEALVTFSKRFCVEYSTQFEAIHRLQSVGEMVPSLLKKSGNRKQVLDIYRKQLEKINERLFDRVESWRNPLDPNVRLGRLNVAKCRFMSSKMAPLWLVFENSDPEAPPLNMILKVGDDVRQDIVTLQQLRLFERLWWSQNIDLRMSPYTCIATGITARGKGVGLIQVVTNAETTSRIHWQFGGRFGALHSDTLFSFLEKNNPTPSIFERAQEHFIHSCAGYCVASFVLGLGDRHNGNIMIKKDGHLFHIDFGHILGNFKSKAGINRERAAFVITPEMAFIISGKMKKYKKHPNWVKFIDLTLKAYQALRNNSKYWASLFSMLVPSGLPELSSLEDIEYMMDTLMESATPAKAAERITQEIDRSISTKWRQFDNLVHTWIHEAD